MIELLRQLIAVPSFSRDEAAAADVLQAWMASRGLPVSRHGNNLWVAPDDCADGRPVILLNSHIDTVRPASGYTRNPFAPDIEDGRLYGLGSNDAGGPLVALLGAYMQLASRPQSYKLVFAATAEEEVSGHGGIESLLPLLGRVDLGIVGEPTRMQMAVAEKGLMVLDCTAHGRSGHAARNEGDNAIYRALPDIEWFRNHRFERVSQFLGSVKMTVTQIEAGTQHNVVPDECRFVVDVRPNGMYSNVELLAEIRRSVNCEVSERSTRLNSSSIAMSHPVVQQAQRLGIPTFGSPTMSDQALMPFPTVKIGPGDSARSHTADEYIGLDEISSGIETYVRLLDGLNI